MVNVDNLDIGGAIDLLYSTRQQRLNIEKDVKALKSDELVLRTHIIRELEKIGLDGGKGKEATAAVVYEEVPNVTDWDAVWDYIHNNHADDLVQRRISVTAIRDRWSNGETVPGVDKFASVDLSLTKRSK